jgi:hypothetical protein
LDANYFNGVLFKDAKGKVVHKLQKPFKQLMAKGNSVYIVDLNDKKVTISLPAFGFVNAINLIQAICVCDEPAAGGVGTTGTVVTTGAIIIGGVTYAAGTPTQQILNALNAVQWNTTSVVTTAPITIDGVLYPIGMSTQQVLAALANKIDWGILGNAGTVQATNFLGTTDNIGLSFRTNNAIRQTITNTGKVGIGTTAPRYQFENIIGTSAGTPFAGDGIINSISNAGGARFIQEQNNGPAFGKAMLYETNLGVTKFSSLSDNWATFVKPNILTMGHLSGNVGINNATAANKLEVTHGTANNSGLRLTNLTSASPTVTGGAIGVDANGDVVRIAAALPVVLGTYTTDATAAAGGVAIGDEYWTATGTPYPTGAGFRRKRLL